MPVACHVHTIGFPHKYRAASGATARSGPHIAPRVMLLRPPQSGLKPPIAHYVSSEAWVVAQGWPDPRGAGNLRATESRTLGQNILPSP